MSQEFSDLASLKFDPTNQVGVKFEEWGRKINRYAEVQNKPLTRDLLEIATLQVPHGKKPEVSCMLPLYISCTVTFQIS